MEGADKNEERGKQRVLSQSEARIRERRERRSEREEREREKRRRGERAEGERWRGGRNTFGREHRQELLEVGRKRNRKRQRREEEGERVTKELNSCKSILSLPFVCEQPLRTLGAASKWVLTDCPGESLVQTTD